MIILAINRDILGQFLYWRYSLRLIFLSISFSLLLLPKPSLFPRTTKPVSERWQSRIHLSLDHREIWAPGSEIISKHSHRWELWKHVGYERNTLCIIAFSFLIETQNHLSKTVILDSLTIGLSWNFDMWFEINLRTSSSLGFAN